MLITIIALLILVISITIMILTNVDLKIWDTLEDKYNIYYYEISDPAKIVALIDIFIVFFCVIIIISSHIGIDYQIEKANVEYETLLAKVDAVNSNYEDISKVDVLTEVRNWNRSVLSEKFWSNHILTNWFHSKRYVDSLKLIDINSIKK